MIVLYYEDYWQSKLRFLYLQTGNMGDPYFRFVSEVIEIVNKAKKASFATTTYVLKAVCSDFGIIKLHCDHWCQQI